MVEPGRRGEEAQEQKELLEFLHPAEEQKATEGDAQALEQAKNTLAHVREIAETAVDRAAAADRRATTSRERSRSPPASR
jgi:hypothetical protein